MGTRFPGDAGHRVCKIKPPGRLGDREVWYAIGWRVEEPSVGLCLVFVFGPIAGRVRENAAVCRGILGNVPGLATRGFRGSRDRDGGHATGLKNQSLERR